MTAATRSADAAPVVAPTRIAATFIGGSLAGKWSYLPAGAPEYRSPGWGERYTLARTVSHSEEDDVVSYQVYQLSPLLFRAPASGPPQTGTLRLGEPVSPPRGRR